MAKKVSFGFSKSDCIPMTPLNKGEILWLNKQGFTMKDIAGMTNRSMDWVSNIIGALTGCDIHDELVKKWEDKKDGKSKNNDRRLRSGDNTRKINVPNKPKSRTKTRRKSVKSMRVQRTITGLSRVGIQQYNNSSKRVGICGNKDTIGKRNSKGLKKGLESHVDNKRG